MAAADRIIQRAQQLSSLRELISIVGLLLVSGIAIGMFTMDQWRAFHEGPSVAFAARDSIATLTERDAVVHAQIDRRLAKLEDEIAKLPEVLDVQRDQSSLLKEIRCVVQALADGRRPSCIGAGVGG